VQNVARVELEDAQIAPAALQGCAARTPLALAQRSRSCALRST
jgi:hypothetical protein